VPGTHDYTTATHGKKGAFTTNTPLPPAGLCHRSAASGGQACTITGSRRLPALRLVGRPRGEV